MKLIVQIPCLDEAETLPATLADIPRQIDGIDCVEVLVIDDGSSDGTADVARDCGADHVIRFPRNRGLGRAFSMGFEACIRLGADIIVNTDGDNQYNGSDITTLVQPILEGRADIVIGDRQTGGIAQFSFAKRLLQRFGSVVVGRLAGLRVPDVASGFRAYSREAALQLSTFTDFDHTAEHVVQAGQDRLAVVSVPIGTNPKARESRLFSNVGQFVVRSGTISLRTYARYKALKIFATFGALTFLAGVVLGVRFLYFFFLVGEADKYVQSLILASILLLAGFQMFLTGVVADLIATNRSLLEEALTRIRRIELSSPADEGKFAATTKRPVSGPES